MNRLQINIKEYDDNKIQIKSPARLFFGALCCLVLKGFDGPTWIVNKIGPQHSKLSNGPVLPSLVTSIVSGYFISSLVSRCVLSLSHNKG